VFDETNPYIHITEPYSHLKEPYLCFQMEKEQRKGLARTSYTLKRALNTINRDPVIEVNVHTKLPYVQSKEIPIYTQKSSIYILECDRSSSTVWQENCQHKRALCALKRVLYTLIHSRNSCVNAQMCQKKPSLCFWLRFLLEKLTKKRKWL